MLDLKNKFNRFLWHPLYENDPSLWEPKEIVADAKLMHANVIHWHATGSSTRSNYVFYQSKKLQSFPLMGDRDFLAEMVEECHKNDIYLIAYINVHWSPDAFYEKHQDWLQTTADGEPVERGYGQGGPMCTNSTGYREEWIRTIVEEVVPNYDVDGIFLDGPARREHTCYCPDCRRLFREAYGEEMPTKWDWSDPNFRNFIRFGYDSQISFIEFVTNVAQKIKPEFVVYSNGTVLRATWSHGISPQNCAKVTPMIGAESFMYYIRPLDVPSWKASAVSKYLTSSARGKASCTYLHYCQCPWHISSMSRDQHHLNIATTAANGCYPFMTIDDTSRQDRRRFEAIGEMYGFIEANQDAYIDTKSMANIGIVYSQRTSDFYERGEITAAGGTHDYYCTGKEIYTEEFDGFYEALMHTGFAFDVICDEAMNEQDLDRFDVIILPNTACLTEETIKALKKHVAAGKGLIASYHASFCDAEGQPLSQPSLVAELGIGQVKGKMEKPAVRDYLKLAVQHQIFGDLQVGAQVVLPKHNLDLRAAEDAQVLAHTMPLRSYGYEPQGEVTDSVAVIAKSSPGRCLYFSGLIGEHYKTYGIPDHQEIITRAVEWTAKKITAKVVGCPNVEVTVYRKEDRWFIHLINYTSRPQLPIQNIQEVSNLKIDLSADIPAGAKARSIWSKRELPVETTDNGLRISLDKMQVYEVICVEPK